MHFVCTEYILGMNKGAGTEMVHQHIFHRHGPPHHNRAGYWVKVCLHPCCWKATRPLCKNSCLKQAVCTVCLILTPAWLKNAIIQVKRDLGMSLVNRSRTGPKRDSWVTPLVTSLQVEYKPLTTMLWPSDPASFPHTSSDPPIQTITSQLGHRKLGEMASNTQLKSRWHPLLSLIYRFSRLFSEGNQVGHAQVTICKDMLAIAIPHLLPEETWTCSMIFPRSKARRSPILPEPWADWDWRADYFQVVNQTVRQQLEKLPTAEATWKLPGTNSFRMTEAEQRQKIPEI